MKDRTNYSDVPDAIHSGLLNDRVGRWPMSNRDCTARVRNVPPRSWCISKLSKARKVSSYTKPRPQSPYLI
ncbi:hypothetical protein SeMB42_g02776 [Synchytrium endobioticum]|uniref:Uncharacterized protein n=1 Tax=Synchytrium endobioticum TaxID=286115 RepID=A0A507DDR2_9FUNG|nr:hypothetical protein SeMB42_g02776 [Synchytrium endobioticum]